MMEDEATEMNRELALGDQMDKAVAATIDELLGWIDTNEVHFAAKKNSKQHGLTDEYHEAVFNRVCKKLEDLGCKLHC